MRVTYTRRRHLFSSLRLSKYLWPMMISRHFAKRSICFKLSKSFSSTHGVSFISNFFGSKQVKQNEELVKNQDNFAEETSKIVILGDENSPKYQTFDPSRDMPDFHIKQWKNHTIKNKDIESSYTSELLKDILERTYHEVNGKNIDDSFASVNLTDLSFRFKYAKALQQNLGFDIDDYTLTRSHDLKTLFDELHRVISKRWTSERNPNAIVLREEDFTAPNVYLSREPTQEEQDGIYKKLVDKAQTATSEN